MMDNIPMETGFIISGLLFTLGLLGILIRRNVIFMLMSIEIMLNAAGLAGQVMFIFILAVAAAEVSIGLALIILIYQKFKTLDMDQLNRMKG